MKEKKDKKVDVNNYFDKVETKGRPCFLINEQGKIMVQKLASFMCTDEEISSVLGVSVDVLTNERNKEAYAECKKRGLDSGKASLRRKQYEVAMGGNCSMLIWLGKQYLGQKEQIDASVSGNGMLENILGYMKNGNKQ